MKKFFVIALSSLGFGTHSFADSNIFGTGVVLTLNGAKVLYESTLLGDGRHAPINVTPTPTLDATGFNGLSLGTFNPGLGNTFVFNGGEILTFKNGTDNITSANIFYKIDSNAFTSFGLTFNQDNVNNNAGDQRWYGEGANVNVLNGLSNGPHTLSVYFETPFTFTGGSGTHTENNTNSNFTATFNVVPEPSTIALIGLSSLGMIQIMRRKSR